MGLVGYDCGSRSLNVTTLSLLDVGECDIPEDTVNDTDKYIQLLQVNDYLETRVYQCKIDVHRTIYKCGMFSHISIVTNGESEFLQEISQQTCFDAHATGTLKLTSSHVIHGLRVNNTVTHSVMLAGSVNSDGECEGAAYSDPYGTWNSVVVQGTVTISLFAYTARIALNKNQIHLNSGTVCPLGNGNCIDSEGGYTFWSPIPIDSCRFNHYGVLYEGLASKMIDLQMNRYQTIYSLTTNDITFALTAKDRENVCGYSLIRTEHPKLFILETSRGNTFATGKRVPVNDLDIFAYVNSKFVYVEKHIRTQMKQLYRDVTLQRCNLERQTLKNALTIATQSPDEFAYNLMKGPGYMAVLAGEVVHIVKCVPVEVRIEHGTDCYAELQVSRKNSTFFLTPRTHILKTKGTRIACNAFLPAYYQIGDSWYKILPQPTEARSPIVIQPATKATWKYINPADLATSGIYTERDLNDLRERIMFPVERPALLNDLAREMNGHPVESQEGAIFKLLNEDAVSKLVTSAWDHAWSKFLKFGTVSAAIIALMMIFQLIKIIVDIVIRGYTLHSVFGWSLHLLGALWGTIAHVLLHGQQTPSSTQDIELGNVSTSPSNSSSSSTQTTPTAPDPIPNTESQCVYPQLSTANEKEPSKFLFVQN